MQFMFLGGRAAAANYQTTVEESSGSTTGLAFGPEYPRKLAVVAIRATVDTGVGSIASATIDGAAATVITQAGRTVTGGRVIVAVISKPLTSSSANVSLTFSSGGSIFGVAFSSYGVTDLVSHTAIDTANYSDIGDPASTLIDAEKYGVIIGRLWQRYDTSATFAGIDTDYSATGSSISEIAGHFDVTATQVNRPITITNNSPDSMQAVMAVASFR